MKKKFSIRLFAVLAILPALLAGCQKFVAIDPPPTQVEANLVFETDQTATAAVVGLYSRMTQSNLFLMSGAVTIYPGLSSDEFYNSVTSADMDLFLKNSLIVNSGTGVYSRLWRSAYQFIYHTNAVLEGIEKNQGTMTDSIKFQLKGEMLFTRSLLYFYLVNLYGDVPFEVSTDYHINQSLPRTGAGDIYAHIISDLVLAKSLLKADYLGNNRLRPNKWTATALLARVYLYRKDWNHAELEANEVIQSGRYSLPIILTNVFLIASPETIWQLGRDNNNTSEGFSFVPASATQRPPYVLNAPLVNSFEAADKRKANWISKSTVSGVDYFYPYKYKARTETPITEYYVVLRLAEQYLIRAEARAMQNNLTGSKADIDVIRARAGLPSAFAATQQELLLAIEKERRTELFAEWGHRWMDIIRWNKADLVFGPVKSPNWQSTDILYPIPLREMQNNPFLTQNPGY